MAEEVGFEPTEGFHLRRFSRPVHSTALPPLRGFCCVTTAAVKQARIVTMRLCFSKRYCFRFNDYRNHRCCGVRDSLVRNYCCADCCSVDYCPVSCHHYCVNCCCGCCCNHHRCSRRHYFALGWGDCGDMGARLSRLQTSCGFRWSAVVHRQCDAAVALLAAIFVGHCAAVFGH